MKNITQALKVIALALILSFGISYVYAWTAPTQRPPSGNVSTPINTSATAQYKAGAFGVEGLIMGYSNIEAATQIKSPQYCIGASCITAWPTGGVTPPTGSEFLNTSAVAQTKAGAITAAGLTSTGTVTGAGGITTGLSATEGTSCTGTGTIAKDAVGTGKILTCQSNVWKFSAAAGAGGYGIDRSFSTQVSTSWTAPPEASTVRVFIVGGGGGASYMNPGLGYNDIPSGGGGGAGGYEAFSTSVTPGQSYYLQVGIGGALNTDGGDTVAFGHTAFAGKRGRGGYWATESGDGGAGGYGATGYGGGGGAGRVLNQWAGASGGSGGGAGGGIIQAGWSITPYVGASGGAWAAGNQNNGGGGGLYGTTSPSYGWGSWGWASGGGGGGWGGGGGSWYSDGSGTTVWDGGGGGGGCGLPSVTIGCHANDAKYTSTGVGGGGSGDKSVSIGWTLTIPSRPGFPGIVIIEY